MGTSSVVANGSDAGVKMSVVVPDQRKVPLTAGSMWNQGTLSAFGILPTTTIGSLQTNRTSFAFAGFATSPTGPDSRQRAIELDGGGRAGDFDLGDDAADGVLAE